MNLPEPLDTTTSVVDLRRKLLFSVSQNLISSRSCGLIPPHPVPLDPWNVKAPDFTPKLYRSVGLPRIKSKNIHLVKSNDSVDQKSFVLEKIKDGTSTLSQHKEQSFLTFYKPPDSLETKLLFVRAGTNPVGPYKDPKPHNFRPCAEGMPDMVTSIKDPNCLFLKSQCLKAVTHSHPDLNPSHRDKMDTFKPAELKWDPSLILPKMPWPPKSASYTRYRRRRGVYSALMDRIEEKLTNSWRK
ncbi:uncharacterized protein si:dkey-30e9.6 [Pimephales promelas]|uniref:uncharacterized protein si:dkey-30e9.6 n=1 Tax=Pimephales promelas TaxID=90988 RepID=UPI001955745B|nr:uncharacterized protein si:dkey-30e9.6 [Pimephales promelas]XP_039526886.1 uncharacterized protein si:dkey-30e9.6 [Pimephales promelas]XP_039526887.1 uncharacterized protein si:dkey-30e9.6 [Pimephales promelas]KAG1951933.1 hypothetical protein F2P79_010777 [Pimephales promelas]